VGMVAALTVLQNIPTLPGTLYTGLLSKQLVQDLTTNTPSGITRMTSQDFDLVQAAKASLNRIR
jgi:hypothetical protein